MSAARRFVLALDQGTTGSTALVVDGDGAVRARGYAELPQHYPRPGWVEHDPEDIWTSTETASGQFYVPNLPTEEVFTTPDWRRTEGHVRATQPLVLVGGTVVNDLEQLLKLRSIPFCMKLYERREDMEALIGNLISRRDDVMADTEELSRKLSAAVEQHRAAGFDLPEPMEADEPGEVGVAPVPEEAEITEPAQKIPTP